MVDYIGRSERLRVDWAEIIDHINTRENTTFPLPAHIAAVNKQDRGDSASNCIADSYATMYNATTLENVARHYAMDVVRFGFLRPETSVSSIIY